MHREVTRRVFKFRLYPTEEQSKQMFKFIEVCRRLWNDALTHRKTRWEKYRQSTSYALQQWILTAERKADPELRALYAQCAQNVLRRLDLAYQAFFKGIPTETPTPHGTSSNEAFGR